MPVPNMFEACGGVLLFVPASIRRGQIRAFESISSKDHLHPVAQDITSMLCLEVSFSEHVNT